MVHGIEKPTLINKYLGYNKWLYEYSEKNNYNRVREIT